MKPTLIGAPVGADEELLGGVLVEELLLAEFLLDEHAPRARITVAAHMADRILCLGTTLFTFIPPGCEALAQGTVPAPRGTGRLHDSRAYTPVKALRGPAAQSPGAAAQPWGRSLSMSSSSESLIQATMS